MNSGERDEILIKLYLVKLRDLGESINGIRIESVGFDGHEYGILPRNVHNKLPQLRDDYLIQLADSMGIIKGGTFDKSDVYINGIGYSLKSHSAAPPAIVNHTTRPGFENVCNQVGVSIHALDSLIDDYWDLRLGGEIGEDIRNSDPRSPFRHAKNILKPILEYFLFVGSGSRKSKHPADFVLEYLNPCDQHTWNILDPSMAVEQLWGKLIFSVRANKGMPRNYNIDTYAGKNASSIAKWVRYDSGNFRGALHIRAHK